jgi:post-segregation antitoxin (ccd killing protein)
MVMVTDEDPSRNSLFGHYLITVSGDLREDLSTVELDLSELIETASYPEIQKIRIIGFFLENRLYWKFEVWVLL